MKKRDGVRVHHEKKSESVRVHHEIKSDGVRVDHDSSATVCHVNDHGLFLFGILEGAPLFLCYIISQWLGLLDTGSNSSPEVFDSLCISYSDF